MDTQDNGAENDGTDSDDVPAKEFICPECGSREVAGRVHVTTVPNPRRPWSDVLERIECGKCHCIIPAHLGERWDGLSLEHAQREWKEIYRNSER